MSANLSQEGRLLEDTELLSNDGHKSRLMGLKDWSVSGSGFFKSNQNAPGIEALSLIQSSLTTRSPLWVKYFPDGQDGWFGSAKVEILRVSGEVDGLDKIEVTFQATDTLEPVNVSLLPSDLPNLHHWLDATSLSLSNGDPVETWSDSGPQGYTATQTNLSFRPTYVTSVLNGLPVVRFDGFDDRMDFPSLIASDMGGLTSVEFFLVHRLPISGGNQVMFVFTVTGAGAPKLTARRTTNDGYTVGGRPSTAEGFQPFYITPHQPGWDHRILQTMVSPLDKKISARVNAKSLGGRTYAFVDDAYSAQAGTVHRIGGPTTEFVECDIAEFIMYRRTLSILEQFRIEQYLSQKWGIALAP